MLYKHEHMPMFRNSDGFESSIAVKVGEWLKFLGLEAWEVLVALLGWLGVVAEEIPKRLGRSNDVVASTGPRKTGPRGSAQKMLLMIM